MKILHGAAGRPGTSERRPTLVLELQTFVAQAEGRLVWFVKNAHAESRLRAADIVCYTKEVVSYRYSPGMQRSVCGARPSLMRTQ